MIETFQKFGGSGGILCWFAIAWLYLWCTEKQRDRRIIFLYMPAIVLLLFFNPLFYKIFGGVTEEAIYFRFLWLIPITLVIGYTIVQVGEGLQKKKRNCFIMLAVLVLMVSGKLVYRNPLYSRAENMYHVPQTVVEICDAIEVEGREIMALFPREFLLYVRQYSAVVCMPYGRNEYMGGYNELYRLMNKEELVVEEIVPKIREYGCHYVILGEDKKLIGNLKDCGFELLGEVDGYKIYRDTTAYFGLWDEEI